MRRNPAATPVCKMLEDLNLISSAGSRDQLFGAFLYSNACVVAGLRAAARLAADLGHTELKERWNAFADRIWNQGILPAVATSRDKSAGLSTRSRAVPQCPKALEAARFLDRESRPLDRACAHP